MTWEKRDVVEFDAVRMSAIDADGEDVDGYTRGKADRRPQSFAHPGESRDPVLSSLTTAVPDQRRGGPSLRPIIQSTGSRLSPG